MHSGSCVDELRSHSVAQVKAAMYSKSNEPLGELACGRFSGEGGLEARSRTLRAGRDSRSWLFIRNKNVSKFQFPIKTRSLCHSRNGKWHSLIQRRVLNLSPPMSQIWPSFNLLEYLICPLSSKVINPLSKRAS